MKNVTEMGTFFLKNKKLNLGPALKKQVMPVEESSYSMKTIYQKAMDLLLSNLREM